MRFRMFPSFVFLVLHLLLACYPNVSFSKPLFQPYDASRLRLTTQLQGSYVQNFDTYNRANVALETKSPAFNPDEADEILNVECKDGDVIVMKIRDPVALKEVQQWPANVILMISHDWHCFGKEETLFYMTYDTNVDFEKEEASFQVNPCDISNHTDTFSLSLTYHKTTKHVPDTPTPDVKETKKMGIFARIINFFKRLFRKSEQKVKMVIENNKEVSVYKENVVDLNFLYDSEKNASSKRNFALSTAQPGISQSLICVDCYTHGKAAITLQIEGKMLPRVNISKAFISVNGDLEFNFDIRLDRGLPVIVKSSDVRIMSLSLTPFHIPGLFSIGPELSLTAAAGATTTVIGSIYTGGNIAYRNFHIEASLTGSHPQLKTTGFEPIITPKEVSADFAVASSMFGTLKPQLSMSVNLLNGALVTKAGLEFASTLGATVLVGGQSMCANNRQLHVETSFGHGLRWFVQGKSSTFVSFQRRIVGKKCV
ncbi:9909_t:CDS:1 [Paraglomus brasilianum]|uniref:9909_t:CDS:1 n=1 Tax=Paraglomus brasilianum TaxID=144538 RepID=A0A9N8Z647_9GLOM|nr:9909_t:CDS:1 [Paraglomus brasilianum]